MTPAGSGTTPGVAIRVEPATDEAWDGYLHRVADAHRCSVQALADQIGLRVAGRWPAFHGVALSPAVTERVAERLGLTPWQVADMQLTRYDQIAVDLSGLDYGDTFVAARTVARRGWIILTGTRFCPVCLADDGVWRLAWRLPWITCCPRHRLLLAHACVRCGAMPGTGRVIRMTRPARAHLVADRRCCTHPGSVAYSTCLAWLPDTTARTATDTQLAYSAATRELLSRQTGTVAGVDWPALAVFRAWQAAACLALAFGVATSSEHPPGRSRWLTTPRDSAVMAGLHGAALELCTPESADEAADVLLGWCRHAGIRTPSPGTVRDAAPTLPALRPVVHAALRSTGRAHSILIRNLALLDGQERIRVTDFDIDDIPQLVWPCALPAELRTASKPSTDLIRAVTALTLARIAGAASWAQAGQALGWSDTQATQWVRYVFRSGHHGLRTAITHAALTIAPLLARQPRRRRWAARPVLDGSTPRQLALAQRPDCSAGGGQAWCPCWAATDCAPANRGTRAVSA